MIQKIKFLLLIVGASLYSQQSIFQKYEHVFPPSPEASALARYVEIPVNLYTGVPEINLELTELKGNNLSLPVSIKYHASGIKVKDISSSVGLGWSLNAGGVITRVVRGLPDEEIKGYIGEENIGKKIANKNFSEIPAIDIFRFGSNYYDSEPDVYYFHFLNYSGKFTFNADGDIIMYSEQDIRIIPAIGPRKKDDYWTIITKDGIKYKFGITKNSKEKSNSVIKHGNFPSVTSNFISSWYLDEIQHPTGEKVAFNYIRGTSTEDVIEIESYEALTCGSGYVTTKMTNTIERPVYLQKISNQQGYIDFIYTNGRQDYKNSKKLTEISLFSNYDSKYINKIIFNQSYFVANNCASNDYTCKRLKLNKVYEKNSSGTSELKYGFGYNPSNLPSRKSPQIDHWGYFNKLNQQYLAPRTNPFTEIYNFRLPKEAATKSNVLEKITYKTGGFTEFKYELNEFRDNSRNNKTGGLRIKSVTQNPGDTNSIIKKYAYNLRNNQSISSGSEFRRPIYMTTKKLFFRRTIPNSPANCNSQEVSCNGKLIKSSSLNHLFDLNGSNVGYSEVNVLNPDGSTEQNKFTNKTTNPDIINSNDYLQYLLRGSGDNTGGSPIEYLNPLGSPYAPPSISKSHERGLLKEKSIYNTNGDILYKLINHYSEINFNRLKSTKGLKINTLLKTLRQQCNPSTGQLYSIGWYNLYNIGMYTIKNSAYQLTKSEEEFYSTSRSEVLKKTTSLTYNNIYPTMITQKTFTDSKNNVNHTFYKYPFNFRRGYLGFEFDDISGQWIETDNRNIYAKMADSNYISPIIEEVNSAESFATYGTINEFKQITTTDHISSQNYKAFVPKRTWDLESKKSYSSYTYATASGSNLNIDSGYHEILNYKRYDDKGNITELAAKDYEPSCIIWGYNETFPIAKIENASYSDISQYINNLKNKSDNDKDQTTGYLGYEGTLRLALDKLRNDIPKAMITTYTYDPLVGVTSITDPRGYSTYYIYDEYKRLKATKDDEENVVSKNDYNYQPQN